MAVSVKDILNVPTIDQLNQQYWQSQPNSIRQVRARGFGLFYQLIQGMLLMLLSLWKMLYAASYNLSDLNNASGNWLTIIAKGYFDLDRIIAQPTTGILVCNFTNAVTSVTFTNQVTGIVYTGPGPNLTGVYSVTVTASVPGSVGNCPINQLVSGNGTAYTLTSTNVLGTNWIAIAGSAGESDVELRLRCMDQLAMQSTGTNATVAANIRTATNQQAYRVLTYVPSVNPNVTVYVAGKTGDYSATAWDTVVINTAQQYLSPSYSANVIHAPAQYIFFSGLVLFSAGTDSAYISKLQAGLADFINGWPLYDGTNPIYLYQISQEVISVLDTQNRLDSFQFVVLTQGITVAGMNTPVPSTIGNRLLADFQNGPSGTLTFTTAAS